MSVAAVHDSETVVSVTETAVTLVGAVGAWVSATVVAAIGLLKAE